MLRSIAKVPDGQESLRVTAHQLKKIEMDSIFLISSTLTGECPRLAQILICLKYHLKYQRH